jgi:hypothetical protein
VSLLKSQIYQVSLGKSLESRDEKTAEYPERMLLFLEN